MQKSGVKIRGIFKTIHCIIAETLHKIVLTRQGVSYYCNPSIQHSQFLGTEELLKDDLLLQKEMKKVKGNADSWSRLKMRLPVRYPSVTRPPTFPLSSTTPEAWLTAVRPVFVFLLIICKIRMFDFK